MGGGTDKQDGPQQELRLEMGTWGFILQPSA